MLHKYLEHFKTCAEEGSLTAAANKLNISQPSLSRSIGILEDDMGVSLFDRRSRGVELTPYGKSLYRHSCFMEQEFEYARSEIEGMRSGALHTIRIGAGLLWLFNYLPDVYHSYQKIYPNVRFEVVSGHSQTLFSAFLAGQYDIILCDLDGVQKVEGAIYEKIINVNFTLFARNDHPIFRESNLDESCLGKYQFVIFNHSEKEYLSPVQDIRRYNGINRRQIKLVTTSIINLFETLTRSDMIASLPQQLSRHAANYNLKEISPLFRCSPFTSGAIYRAVSERKKAIQNFIEILREVARKPHSTVESH